MSDSPAPQTTQTSSAPRRGLAPVLTAAALVVVLVAVGIGAYVLVRGTGDKVVNAAPAGSTLYMSADLTPSAAQTNNLNNLIHKFPATSSNDYNSLLNSWLDAGLQSSGMSHTDIRSWLGSQIAFVGGSALWTDAMHQRTPKDFAILVSSTNDSAAQSTFDKARTAKGSLKWSKTTYNSVDIQQGVDSSGALTAAYAVFNHVAVIATSMNEMDQVIDTGKGKTPDLTTNGRYTEALGNLPSDRLTTFYVDLSGLVTAIKSMPSASSVPTSALAGIDAYKAFAAGLVAQANGVSLIGTATFDAGKLTADQRTQMQTPAHLNTILSAVPQNAFGFVAGEGFDKTLTTLLNTYSGLIPAGSLDSWGLSGTNSILGKLTGDIGFEADPAAVGTTFPLNGSLLLGTSDDAAMQAFLDADVQKITALVMSSASSATTPVAPKRNQTNYKGSTITSLATGLDEDFPAWTAYKGMGIVGGSVREVKAVMDTRDGANITANAAYNDAIPAAQQKTGGEMYIDFHAINKALTTQLQAPYKGVYLLYVAPITDHLTEFSVTGQSSSDHSNFTAFLGIG